LHIKDKDTENKSLEAAGAAGLPVFLGAAAAPVKVNAEPRL
jgi:hypothetical protein